MTSLPNTSTFFVGSASSGYSVRDAFESYRRSQYLVAETTVASTSDVSDIEDDDEEAGFGVFDDEDELEEPGSDNGDITPRPRLDDTDPLIIPGSHTGDYLSTQNIRAATSSQQPQQSRYGLPPRLLIPAPASPRATENSRLLRKAVSFSAPHPRRTSNVAPVKWNDPAFNPTSDRPAIRRKGSSVSDKHTIVHYGGKSTFGQTLFNAIAVLLGIGMLSEPLAFVHAGWLAGTGLIVFYGLVTCYTAKLLAGIILADPRMRSYSDIGRKAFGPSSSVFISLFFCLELFAVSVVLVTLYADSLHTIIPAYSTTVYKLGGLLILLPTVFMPLSLLSYASILGIFSTVLMIAVILIDGLSKTERPGSLWSPAETTIGIPCTTTLGLSFGLFMAGFSGHAVIPSLARDMQNPEQFDTVINWAFGVATVVYALIGYAGYMMFGADVSDEISIDLLRTSGYNPLLNKTLLWMLVVSPLTKFALTTQPMNVTIEVLLGLTGSQVSAEDHLNKQAFQSTGQGRTHGTIKRTLAVIQRIILTLLAVGTSILIPEFGVLMGFLGSFSAFFICIIGPIFAKMVIFKKVESLDAILLVISCLMAAWGCFAAFWVSE